MTKTATKKSSEYSTNFSVVGKELESGFRIKIRVDEREKKAKQKANNKIVTVAKKNLREKKSNFKNVKMIKNVRKKMLHGMIEWKKAQARFALEKLCTQ